MNPVLAIPSYSLRSILILPCHLCLCITSGLFHSGFRTKTLRAHLLSLTRATWPAHPACGLLSHPSDIGLFTVTVIALKACTLEFLGVSFSPFIAEPTSLSSHYVTAAPTAPEGPYRRHRSRVSRASPLSPEAPGSNCFPTAVLCVNYCTQFCVFTALSASSSARC
jgi:hypothetical protein